MLYIYSLYFYLILKLKDTCWFYVSGHQTGFLKLLFLDNWQVTDSTDLNDEFWKDQNHRNHKEVYLLVIKHQWYFMTFIMWKQNTCIQIITKYNLYKQNFKILKIIYKVARIFSFFFLFPNRCCWWKTLLDFNICNIFH